MSDLVVVFPRYFLTDICDTTAKESAIVCVC